MNPWFIWNGKSSLTDFGLWIKKLPKRVRPEERHEEIEVPGRSGSLTMLEGKDVFSSYAAEMTVIAINDINIDRVISWLRGSGDLILSNDINRARTARIVNEVAFERVNNSWMEAVIPFSFQPFRKSVYPANDQLTITGASGTIFNPGDVASRPILTVNASAAGSDIQFSVNGNQFRINMTGMADTGCIVDCSAMMVTNYSATADLTMLSSGEFPILEAGDNAFTIISGVSSIVIDPNWRWL